MRGVDFYGGKGIWIETLLGAHASRGAVVIQIEATGVCGTDLHAYHADRKSLSAPRIGGHESTGRIKSIG